jgi:hypothetical protein
MIDAKNEIAIYVGTKSGELIRSDEPVTALFTVFTIARNRTCARTRGTCAEILRVEESLWTFARIFGVPPTNNAAERHAVIWRRISGGTDSVRGSRFVERMLTVVAT